MITTAVQQASQMVEIQGAPSTVQAESGDFRATFTANVRAPATPTNGQSHKDQGSDAAAAPGGTSSTRQVAGGGVPVKNASTNANQSLLQLTQATEDEDKPQQGLETASSFSSLKTGPESALRFAVTDASIAKNESRSAVLTRVDDETPGKTSALATTIPSATASASAGALKEDDPGNAVEATTAKGRKNGGSDSKKDLSFARAETIVAGTSAVSVTEQTQLNSSAAGVLAGPLLSSDAAASTSGDPASPKPFTATIQHTNTGLKSAQVVEGAAQFAGEIGAVIAKSLGARGVSSPAASDAGTGPQSKAAAAPSASGLNTTEAKPAVPSSEPSGVAVSQKKAISEPYSGAAAPTLRAAQTFTSNAVGIVKDPSAKTQDSEPARGLELTSAGVSLTNGVPVPVQAGANPTLQVDVARQAAPAASLRGGASKIEGGAAKDEKAKTSVDGSGDTVAPTSLLTGVGDASSVPSSPVALAGSVAGRAATAADLAVPVAVATPHAGVATHAVAGDAASSIAARVQGAVSTGQVAEPASSSVPVGESHRTLLATPTTLEVGVQSGTQGWLRIRAEVGDQGAVNASLAAGTSGGRELLHSQIPALNAFLHSEQMAVKTTVVDRGPLASGSGVASGSGGLGNADGGGSNGSLLQGGGAQSNGARQESPQLGVGLSASDTVRSDTVRSYDARSGGGALDGVVSASSGRASGPGESGRWLNVRV